jgi:hypothetical protein
VFDVFETIKNDLKLLRACKKTKNINTCYLNYAHPEIPLPEGCGKGKGSLPVSRISRPGFPGRDRALKRRKLTKEDTTSIINHHPSSSTLI